MKEDLEKIRDYLNTKGLVCSRWESEGGGKLIRCISTFKLLKETSIEGIHVIKTPGGFDVEIFGKFLEPDKDRIIDYLKTEFDVFATYRTKIISSLETDSEGVCTALGDIINIMRL